VTDADLARAARLQRRHLLRILRMAASTRPQVRSAANGTACRACGFDEHEAETRAGLDVEADKSAAAG